jgi:hypothetical protein
LFATLTGTPYVYFEDEAGRSAAAHLMTRDEARCVAVKNNGCIGLEVCAQLFRIRSILALCCEVTHERE